MHVAVFIPEGHVGFAIRAARVDIRVLAQNESPALGNPDLVIVLLLRLDTGSRLLAVYLWHGKLGWRG
jgi:hypothetical protein